MPVPIDESDGAPEIPERDLKKYEIDPEESVYDLERKPYTSNSKKVI